MPSPAEPPPSAPPLPSTPPEPPFIEGAVPAYEVKWDIVVSLGLADLDESALITALASLLSVDESQVTIEAIELSVSDVKVRTIKDAGLSTLVKTVTIAYGEADKDRIMTICGGLSVGDLGDAEFVLGVGLQHVEAPTAFDTEFYAPWPPPEPPRAPPSSPSPPVRPVDDDDDDIANDDDDGGAASDDDDDSGGHPKAAPLPLPAWSQDAIHQANLEASADERDYYKGYRHDPAGSARSNANSEGPMVMGTFVGVMMGAMVAVAVVIKYQRVLPDRIEIVPWNKVDETQSDAPELVAQRA